MTQKEAVIQTLERLGGIATLGRLYQEVFKVRDCVWNTKTPFASIRSIVQLSNEIFKVRPGLWALESYRYKLECEGIIPSEHANIEDEKYTHGYYQGLLIELGRLQKYETYVPSQDKHRKCLNQELGLMTSISEIPKFSYPYLVKKCSTIDVSWFHRNESHLDVVMPIALFEVEHTTDIQNSLMKFSEMRWFNVKMYIVADVRRRNEFESKMSINVFSDLKKYKKVEFISYDEVVEQYNRLVYKHPTFSLLI